MDDSPGLPDLGALLFDRRTTKGGADVVFEVGEEGRAEEILAHSSVLAARSHVLEAMFCGDFQEANERRVKIRDVQVHHFRAFVEFLYTGSIRVVRDIQENAALASYETHVHVEGVHVKDPSLKAVGDQLFGELLGALFVANDGPVQDAIFGVAGRKVATALVSRLYTESWFSGAGRAVVVDAELLVEVALLWDKYAELSGSDWIVSQLRRVLRGRVESVSMVMRRVWFMRGCDSGDLLMEVCRTAFVHLIADGEASCGSWLDDGLKAHEAQGDGQIGALIRLELLRWANDAVVAAGRKGRLGATALETVQDAISRHWRRASKDLGGGGAGSEPAAKRHRER